MPSRGQLNPAESGDNSMTPKTSSSQTCPPIGSVTLPQGLLFSPSDVMDQEAPVEGTDGQN